MVPEHYLNYRRVFEEQASQDLPPRQKYDHAIDLKEGTEPSNNCKIYPLNPEECSHRQWSNRLLHQLEVGKPI